MPSETDGALDHVHDWRDLPPIDEAEHAAVVEARLQPLVGDPRISQTFLGWRDVCHRAAFLYAKHRGGAGGHQLNRGTIFHAVVERLTRRMMDKGQRQISSADAKVELRAVLREHPELVVPAAERDYLRMLVHHWAVGFAIDPSKVLGVEESLTLKLGDWTIRGKVDLIEQPAPWMVDLTDYKTQRNMPSSDEWRRGEVDQDTGVPRFGGNFQTVLYATLAAFGVDSNGLNIGEGVERWRLFLAFPAQLFEDGIGRKGAEVSTVQLADFRDDLADQLDSLATSIDTRKWQPVPGSHCERCPAEYECPLPKHLRPRSQGASITTIEEAERLAAFHRFSARRNKDLKAAIKAAAEEHDWEIVYTGRDTGFRSVPVDREGFKPKALPQVREAVEGAVRFGHGIGPDGDLDLSQYVSRSQYTEYAERKVPPREDYP